jgi:transcriptional regulator NrdR family protein
MNCPNCHSKTKVVDSRAAGERTIVSLEHDYNGPKIRRRHKCDKCKTRFSTIEIICEIMPPKYNKDRRLDWKERKEETKPEPSDWLARINKKLEE